MVHRITLRILMTALLVGQLAVLGGCSCKPILFKPTVEPLSLAVLPNVPDKVGDLPGTSVGPGLYSRMTKFETQGNNPGHSGKVRYTQTVSLLRVYPDEASTKYDYELNRNTIAPNSGRQVYKEARANGWTYFLTYVMQWRTGVESFCRPIQYYSSSAVFWSRDVYIQIDIENINKTSEGMVDAVQHIANVLAKEFKTEK